MTRLSTNYELPLTDTCPTPCAQADVSNLTSGAHLNAMPLEKREQLYFSDRKIRDIELTPLTNLDYWDRVQMLRYNNGRGMSLDKPKTNEEINFSGKMGRFGEQLEEGVRRWLGCHLPLCEARGLLYSPWDSKNRAYSKQVYEIDAVSTASGVPSIIFEFKIGFAGGARRNAEEQLVERAEILAYKYPHIRCVTVLVSCNPRRNPSDDEIVVGRDLVIDTPTLLQNFNSSAIPCISVDVEPLLAFSQSVGIRIAPDLITVVKSERERRRTNGHKGEFAHLIKKQPAD